MQATALLAPTETVKRRPSLLTALPVLVAFFLPHLAVVLYFGPYGWDDGAITLSFARTFAEEGQFSLTPSSEIVEGFSSPLWLGLMAGAHWLYPVDWQSYVTVSQVASGLFGALTSTVVFFALSRMSHNSKTRAVVLALAAGFSPFFLRETANGMEMELLGFCAVVMATLIVRSSTSSAAWLFVLAALVPAIRLEATAYILAAAVALVVAQRVRAAVAIAAGAVVGNIAILAWRLFTFGEILPNTFAAKQWSPYSQETLGSFVVNRIESVKEIALVLAFIFLAAVIAGFPKVSRIPITVRGSARDFVGIVGRANPAVVFAVAYTAAAILVNLVIGWNWGYLGRMEASAVPVCLLAIGTLAPTPSRKSDSPKKALAVGVLAVIVVYNLPWTNINARNNPEQLSTTPAQYARTGEAARTVASLAGVQQVRFLTPDVGGSSLCCSDIEILDSALLTNSELSSEGWEAFPDYLSRSRPDVVETHDMWSSFSNIYDLPEFRENYRPVVVDNRWLWLRNDHEIPDEACSMTDVSELEDAIYRGSPIDEAYIATLQDPMICQVGTP